MRTNIKAKALGAQPGAAGRRYKITRMRIYAVVQNSLKLATLAASEAEADEVSSDGEFYQRFAVVHAEPAVVCVPAAVLPSGRGSVQCGSQQRQW